MRKIIVCLLCALFFTLCACGQESAPTTTATTAVEITEAAAIAAGPFSHKVTRAINKGMSPYVFTLTGAVDASENAMVGSIEIKEQNGSFSQRLEKLQTEYPVYPEDDYGFSLVDFNSDGYLDIQLRQYMGGSMQNEPSYFWLWDQKSRKFVENRQLMDLSENGGVSVESDQRLSCFTRVSSAEYYTAYYTYQDDTFILVQEDEIKFNVLDDYKVGNQKTTTIKKLIDGKMQVVSVTTETEPAQS